MKIAAIVAIMLCSCQQKFMGLSRGDRVIIYGDVLDVAGHPEIGIPAAMIGKRLNEIDKTAAKNPRIK
jgi:hypothetical protein